MKFKFFNLLFIVYPFLFLTFKNPLLGNFSLTNEKVILIGRKSSSTKSPTPQRKIIKSFHSENKIEIINPYNL